MKFKNYICESEKIQKLTKEDISYLLKTDFSEAWNSKIRGNKIYKGFDISLPTISKIYPKENRRSRNTLNLYTVIINNHPSWSKFPKRNVICSFDYDQACNYVENNGSIKLLLPINGTEIGICPHHDIWYSFSKLQSHSWYAETLNDFLWRLSTFFDWEKTEVDKKFFKNLNGLKKFCENVENEIKKTISFDEKNDLYVRKNEKPLISRGRLTNFNNIFNVRDIQRGNGILYEKIIDIFSPKDFEIQKISKLKTDKYSEVWFDAPFLAINPTEGFLENEI